MEELEAIKIAQEAALKQAEIAAEEAANAAMNIFDEDDLETSDEMSIHSTDDENHVQTPSTRTLSRDKSSPEESNTGGGGTGGGAVNSSDSRGNSFKDPTQPLAALARTSIEGMTNSAILRHVSSDLAQCTNVLTQSIIF